MGVLLKTLVTGAAALYGLSTIGKKIDSSRSKQFIMSADRDILILAEKSGVKLDPKTRCFSMPIEPRQLPPEIRLIEMSLRVEANVYKRSIRLVSEKKGCEPVAHTAVREYDSDHMPAEVVGQYLKHGGEEMTVTIYKVD